MKEVNARVRQLIVDIHYVDEAGIHFDTDVAIEKGYSADEQKEADYILANNNRENDKAILYQAAIMVVDNYRFGVPGVYYIEAVQIVFYHYAVTDTHSFAYEEELLQVAAAKEDSIRYFAFVHNKPLNDEYGNNITQQERT